MLADHATRASEDRGRGGGPARGRQHHGGSEGRGGAHHGRPQGEDYANAEVTCRCLREELVRPCWGVSGDRSRCRAWQRRALQRRAEFSCPCMRTSFEGRRSLRGLGGKGNEDMRFCFALRASMSAA
eukprot:scaffold870_cov268-Pinguiococcus_pyrenoidosus.AAC.101